MVPKRKNARPIRQFANFLLSAATGALLVATLFDLGFFACSAPAATGFLSNLTSDFETAPYLEEDLVELAQATCEYTVGDYGRSEGGVGAARESYFQKLLDAANRAAADEELSARWSARAQQILEREDEDGAEQTGLALGALDDGYSLDEDAMDHLDDCYALIGSIRPVLIAIDVSALVGLVAVAALRGRGALGRVLVASPCVLACALAFLAVWAAIDFNGFFSAFHEVFFPQGNWTFSADSLLICMLPTAFWVGMGLIWIAVGALACIASALVGKRMLCGPGRAKGR